MTSRENTVAYLFYPEYKFKAYWDLFMTLILIITCMLTPLNIAFTNSEESLATPQNIILMAIDGFFLLDIFVIFNSAYYDDETNLIENRRVIAKNYLQGWFTIDLLAIIPFDLILGATDFNQLVRVARVGRLYKLVKLTRLLRILKIIKEKSKLLRYINEILKIGLGFERLFFFILLFLILCHICACLWIIIAVLNAEGPEISLDFDETWMGKYVDTEQYTNTELYNTAFYWTITTITTVGYGDISGNNNLERLFCSIVMIVGVISFSFANGSLASIMQNYDHTNAVY